MGNKLVWVSGDDWQGIYINGKLVREGHSITQYVLISIMNNYTIHIAESKDLNDIGIEWLHDEGCLPDMLIEIPSNYFY